MDKIAIIPARSGSKGLKDKNIIDLCGKPMIFYTMEAALETGEFSRVIVTTDSEKYGQIVSQANVEVIYRDENVSNDNASMFNVIEDLFNKIEVCFDYFVLLQPTSPLRNHVHIQEAIELFESRYDEFDFLVSMKEAEHNRLLVNRIDDDLSLKYFDTDFANYRRQSYMEYSPNGALFIGKPNAYLEKKHFFGKRAIAYKMSAQDSIDVDSEIDYRIAELFIKEKQKERK